MSDYIAFDLGGTKLLMIWCFQGEIHTEKVLSGDSITPIEIRGLCYDFINRSPCKPKHIGMAVPGLLQDGVLIVASGRDNMVGLSEEMLSTDEITFHLINDAKAAIYAEAEHYPNDSTLVVFVCGTGLGTGIKANGTFINGEHGWSTEYGHVPLCVEESEDGCVDNYKVHYTDTLMSGAAILKSMNTDATTLHHLLDINDSKAISVVKRGGFYFGLAIANVVNAFNPKYIVIGGSTSTYKGYLEQAKKTAQQYSLETNWKDVIFCEPYNLPNIVIDGCIAFAHTFE